MKAAEIAELVSGVLFGDPSIEVTGITSLEEAEDSHLCFVTEKLLKKRGVKTKAGVLIIPQGFSHLFPEKTVIEVDDPWKAVLKLLFLFEEKDERKGIAPSAVVAPTVSIGRDVFIGDFSVVEDEVVIEDYVKIYPFCFVGKGSRIGEGTVLFPSVVVYPRTIIGKFCRIHSGCVIGADGFGYFEKDGKREKIPQIGRVVIGDYVEIGANSCVDRATLGSTRIEKGVKIDNLVQIGHNCRIGEHTVIAGQCGLAGSVEVGKRVLMGGQVGVADHVRIGDNVRIGAKSGVGSDLSGNQDYMGIPVMPASLWRRVHAIMKKLPEMYALFKKLKR